MCHYRHMKDILKKLQRIGRQILGVFPTAIPTGMDEFDAWAQSIIKTYDMPTPNQDSVIFTLSTIIMHTGPKTAYLPKLYFYLVIRASAAKQIAGAQFQAIKTKQAEATAARMAVDEQSKQGF